MDEISVIRGQIAYRLQTPAPASSVYAGPGDVVSGATAWWGLRAYSSATIGNNAVRLRRDSDNTEQNFATVAGGGLDTTAISSFAGAANLFLVTLYDQTGNGHDLTQATAGNQVPFILSGIGSLPVLRYNADSQSVANASGLTLADPHTDSWVAKRTGNFTSTAAIMGELDGAPRSGFLNSTNTIFLFAGSVLSATASDSAFHTVQAVYNGGSSDINIDGTSTTGAGGANAYSGSFPISSNIDNVLRGDVVETGIWPVAFSGTQSSNMNSNQRSYWGF